MSIPFIQERLAHLDNYLKEIDTKITQKLNPKNTLGPKFGEILNHAASQHEQVQKNVKAVVKDNFHKLPNGFELYIDNVTHEISQTHQVDINPNLIKSVIKQESGFNPAAKSHAGAQGLMQLMPQTAKEVGVYNSMNPYQNLRGGVKYLAQMMQKFGGDVQKSLAAYNAGPEAVEKYGGIPPYPETQNYVQSIMKDYLRRENYKPVDVIV